MRGTGGQHTPCTSHPKHKQTTRGTNNKSSAPKKNTKKKRNNLGYVSHRPGWRRGELDLDLARNLALAGSDAQDVADKSRVGVAVRLRVVHLDTHDEVQVA